ANQALTGGDERIGEDVPGPRLEPPAGQRGRELCAPSRAHAQVVLQHHCLAIEEEGRWPRRAVRSIEELVHEAHEPLAKASGAVVPLAIPVRVRDYVEL